MSYQTHDLSEWAAFVSLGIGVHAVFSVFYFLLVDADAADFDPRPWLARAGHRLHAEVVRARLAALQARDRARLAAVTALLALALRFNAPASAPKGATHA